MLEVIALLLHAAALDEGKRWIGEKSSKKSETLSHLRVKMITLTHSGGPRRSSVKPSHEAEWWHTAVFCPHSIHIHTFYSCRWSGAIGSGHQMPNMLSVQLEAWWQRHARHKQTRWRKIRPAVGTLLYFTIKRLAGKDHPISIHPTNANNCIFKIKPYSNPCPCNLNSSEKNDKNEITSVQINFFARITLRLSGNSTNYHHLHVFIPPKDAEDN